MIIKKYRSYDLLIGALLLAFDRLFWAFEPEIATKYTQPSWELSQVMLFHGVTILGLTLTLIGLGRRLADQQHATAKAFKIWLYTLALGVITVSVYFWVQEEINATLIYNVLLPVLRNTYPLVSGIIFSLLLLPLYRKFLARYPQLSYVILLVLIVLPTLFGQDMFGFAGGNSISFAMVSFYLGVNLELAPLKRGKFRLAGWTVLACVLQASLISAMPLISQTVHGDLSTSYRFVNSSSFFAVLVAVLVSQWLHYLPGFKQRALEYVALGLIIISGLGEVVNTFVTNSAKQTGHVTAKIVALVTQNILLLLVVLVVVNIAVAFLPSIKRLGAKLDSSLPELDQFEPETTKKSLQAWIKAHRPYLVGLVGAYLLSYASFLLMNLSWQVEPNVDASYNIFTYTLGPRQFQVLFNALIFIMIFKLLWALTNRYWLSEITTAALVIIWTIANRLKIEARNEPIMPSEFSMVKAWGSLIGMVNTWIIVVAVLAILGAIGLIIYLERKYPFGRKVIISRVIWLLIPLIFFNGARYLNHQASLVHIFMEKTGDDPTFYNQLAGAQKNGPFLQFINNLDVEIMAKPAGYSKEKMAQVKARYAKRAQQINATRTNDLGDQIVIFGLSESFSDPTRVPGVQLPADPIPNVRRLKQETTAGYMLSSGYGGGTANMEYMALTGLNLANFSPTLPTPYTQLVPAQNYAPSIAGYFPESVAIHPYIGAFYSRPEVYKKFGFDRFMYVGSKYPIKHQAKIDRSPYLSDQTAFANTLDQIKQAKGGLFINLVTMQNHFPYYNNYYDGSEKFAPTGEMDASVANMIKDFSMGLYHSDQAVQQFIEQLEKIDKPITLVFYGDHLPGIYLNVDMKQHGLALHETDYFIYSNASARKQGAKLLTKGTGLVTPTDFPALTAAQVNAKVSPYYALLTDVSEKLPVLSLDITENTINSYNTNLQLLDQKGKTVDPKSLTKEQKQLLEDYRLVQYDLTAGKQYLKGAFIR